MPSLHALYIAAMARAGRAELALAEAQEQHESEKRELERRLGEAAELALRLSCEVGRLRKALAVAPQAVQLAAIRAFVERVNARAEQDILAGGPITGAHHRALEAEATRE